jgi:hypothetical protein
MGVLVQANDPQDRFSAGRVSVTSHLARRPDCLRPDRLALHPEVLNNPGAVHHSLGKIEHAAFDVLAEHDFRIVEHRVRQLAAFPQPAGRPRLGMR